MKHANKYYKHSGKFGLMGPIYMLIFGALGMLVLSAIYGYAIYYIPFIYLNFLITLGFGACVGILIGYGGKLGKVRNSGLLLIFGLFFGLLAEYGGWVSWVFAFSNQQALALQPLEIFAAAMLVGHEGAWSIFGWTPTGAALFTIWGIEAIMIIGTSTLASWGVVSSTPYCEHCNRWVEDRNSITPLEPIVDPDQFKSKLERSGAEVVKALKKINAGNDAYTQLDLINCPSCEYSYYLSLKSINVEVDSKGKENKDENDIVENYILTTDSYRTISQSW
jgi:hypothetical protein